MYCQITDFYHQFHYAFQQNLQVGYHLAAILKKIRHFGILSWIAFFSWNSLYIATYLPNFRLLWPFFLCFHEKPKNQRPSWNNPPFSQLAQGYTLVSRQLCIVGIVLRWNPVKKKLLLSVQGIPVWHPDYADHHHIHHVQYNNSKRVNMHQHHIVPKLPEIGPHAPPTPIHPFLSLNVSTTISSIVL